MNKNRGIWIVIGSILIIGILVTFTTASFLKSEDGIPDSVGNPALESPEFPGILKESPLDSGTAETLSSSPAASIEGPAAEQKAEAGKAGTAEQEGEEAAAAGSTEISDKAEVRMKLAADSLPDEQAPQKASDGSQAAPVTEPVITPISPDTKNRLFVTDINDGAAYYQKNLEDLDIQIKKMREESGDSNTYSMKALADKELKLWNRELDIIYSAVSENLSEEAGKELEVSQQAWIKSRDAKAEEAAKKYSGGSLEELEYTASLAESARARAYELVAEYVVVLSPEEDQ